MRPTAKTPVLLRESWWWFNEPKSHEICETALNWETLRRTKIYRALWKKCVREKAAFLGSNGKAHASESLRLMHLFARCREATLGLLPMILTGFDPSLNWLQLSKRQRLEADRSLKLPRQSAEAPLGSVYLGLCEIDRDSIGRLCVKNVRNGEPLLCIQSESFFQELRFRGEALLPHRVLCLSFDTRLGREPLLAALRAKTETAFWMPDANFGSSRLRTEDVHVLPGDQPPFAILLVPATCDSKRLRAAFHTQLKTEQRRRWFADCVQHWRSLTAPVNRPVADPDGSTQVDARHRIIRETVNRPLFDPEADLPPERKSSKPASRTNLWLGLAANDLAQAKQPLGKRSPESAFLLEYCETLAELRNHQRSAARRLKELDKHFGRLDKNLGFWLKENARLSRSGFFETAAYGTKTG